MTQLVDRVFDVLEALRSSGRLTLSELSELTDLPKPTLHRILIDLQRRRAVERVGRMYQLGIHMFELGGEVQSYRRPRDIALPYLQDLFESTHEIVHLAVLDSGSVLYLEKIGGHQSTTAPSRVGGRMPLHCTALGKTMLASSPITLLQEVCAGRLQRRTPRTVVAPGMLAQQVDRARHNGYATEFEESALGLICVAAPIPPSGPFPLAAISVGGASSTFDYERVTPAVQTAAKAISRALARA